jgi:hypothetical protein
MVKPRGTVQKHTTPDMTSYHAFGEIHSDTPAVIIKPVI